MADSFHQHFGELNAHCLPAIQHAAIARAAPDMYIPEYTLSTYSLNFMTGGEMRGTLNGAPLHARPGRLTLYCPNDRIMLRGTLEKGTIVCRWAMFTWPAANDGAAGGLTLPRECELNLAAQQKVKTIFDSMLEIAQAAQPGWGIAACARLLELVSLWLAESRHQQNTSNWADDRRIRLSLAFMESNFRRPIKNAEIAAASHLTIDQLKRLFPQAVGGSPLQHLIKLRVQEARRLLAENPRMSVHAACLKAGFGSTKHFSTLFKKHFAVSPRQFRNSAAPWNAATREG